MSETRKAVDRLRWLCAEAETRAREETETDFTKHLSPVQQQMEQLVPILLRGGVQKQHDCVPFRVKVDRPDETDERHAKFYELKSVFVTDPFESHGAEKILSSSTWVDKVGGLVSTKFFGVDEVREWFCLRMKAWVRFLEAESEKLQSSSTAAAALLQMEPPNQTEAEKQTLAKGRKSPRKNGRPPRANLAPKQLEQIHRRVLDGQSLSSIFRSYEVGFSYDTFRRLYYIWQDKQGEGQRSKEQNRR